MTPRPLPPCITPSVGRASLFLLLGVGLVGCLGLDPVPVVCTTEFRSESIRVEDGEGLLLDGVDLDVRRPGELSPWPETGAVYAPLPGMYTVVHDGHLERIGRGRETTVRIRASLGPTRSAETTWVVGADQCHIYKASGPSRLVLP
jgi:hypothetical protein